MNNQTSVSVELEDIQGMIVRGYKHMKCSTYLMVQITDPALFKKYLSDHINEVTDAVVRKEDRCYNLAFTHSGLLALGLLPENCANLSAELRDKMSSPHRSRILGDFGNSAPENWRWGGTKNEEIHAVILLHAVNEEVMEVYAKDQADRLTAAGARMVKQLEGVTLPHNREHFGFRDGISQPTIKGTGRTGPENSYVEPGEFILGYKNGYDMYPESPLIYEEQGDINMLPADANGSGLKDLGRNGSYLVFRQIEEHVDQFWNFINEKTKQADGKVDEKASIHMASKMMGRWPGGAPLAKYPDADPLGPSDDNDFGYYDNDKKGYGCPMGSHVRRSNPRDAFEDNSKSLSLKLTSRRRIIRRARLYGPPIEGSPLDHKPQTEVGLQFICFNASIGLQFEFVQRAWANYPNFNQLGNDPDPFIGVSECPLHGYEQNFTIQGKQTNQTVTGLQRFVTIRGGAYFFFPGIAAIRYLATL